VEHAGQQAQCSIERDATVQLVCSMGGKCTFTSQLFNARFDPNKAEIRVLRMDCLDHLFIFFRLEGTGGVNDASAGANGAQRSHENLALASGLAREVFHAQAVTNLRIAAKGTGAAARNVSEYQVAGGFIGELCDVEEPALDAIAEASEPHTQLLKARRAGLARNDASPRVALCEDQRLAAGRSAAIENLASLPCNLRDKLRAFILKPCAPFAKGIGCRNVAGDHAARRGEQLAWLKMNA
jgi:hypothetical protein